MILEMRVQMDDLTAKWQSKGLETMPSKSWELKWPRPSLFSKQKLSRPTGSSWFVSEGRTTPYRKLNLFFLHSSHPTPLLHRQSTSHRVFSPTALTLSRPPCLLSLCPGVNSAETEPDECLSGWLIVLNISKLETLQSHYRPYT